MVMDRGTAEIQFDQEGEAFFMVDDTAFYLNEFMRADDTPNVGYLTLSNIGGLSASIDPTGEEVYFEFISL
jgi:hypothetical protein